MKATLQSQPLLDKEMCLGLAKGEGTLFLASLFLSFQLTSASGDGPSSETSTRAPRCTVDSFCKILDKIMTCEWLGTPTMLINNDRRLGAASAESLREA